MKQMMKSMAVVAVAVMGLVACQNSVEEPVIDVNNSVVVNFVAEEARTAVDTSGEVPLFSWNESESFAILEQTDALAKATSVAYTKVDGKANINAEFAVNAGKSEYNYVAVYPEAGYVSAENINAVTLALPASQNMAEGSYDSNADLMVSWPVTTTAQPTETQQLRFTRLAAVAKMTLNNLALGADEVVEKVVFSADGKSLAGTIVADLTNNPHEFTVGEGISSVSVATTSASEVYFTLLPTTIAAEEAYSVTVATNKNVYVKQGTIPAEKSLVFEAGMVTRFAVNMSGVTASEKWVLVRDASTLKQGDVVTFVAQNYNYVAGKQTMTAAPIASQTEVVKAGDYLYHNPADATSLDHMMQTYTLVQRDANLNAFDFYNGVDYEGDEVSGFLWATGSSGSPKLQAYYDKNTLFYVEITDGVALVEAKDIEKSYKYLRYYHNKYTASSRKFECTSTLPTGNYQICIYKLEGAVGTIPVVAANVTVPDSDEPIVIAEEGVAEATAIEEVVFNYVGDWAISVSDNADWLTVAHDEAKGCVTYTAEVNTGAVREAVATITASLEGQEPLTWSFNLLQKGAAQEISIAEFITKAVDENVTYKLTGILTEVTSSASGYYSISDADGNIAQVRYLKTDAGVAVPGNDEIGLKVGDVITVTTVVTTSVGKGGNSSNPSIYKGHYGIAVSAGLAADYTGGSVEIKIDTYSNGNITAPTTIEGAMAECDYATFTYSGADTATVSFTSENTTSYAREAIVTFTYGLATASATAQQGINPANKLGYELVLDASTLAVGDEVIIAASNAEKALGVSTSTITSQTNFPGVEIVKSGNVIYDAVESGAQTFTIAEGSKDNTLALTFTHKSSSYYLYVGSTALKGNASTSASYTSFTVAIDSISGAATITNSASTAALVSYNATSGKFGATKVSSDSSTDNDVAIYRKQK